MKKTIKADSKTLFLFIMNIMLLLPLAVFGGQNFSIDSYGVSLDQGVHIRAFIGSFRWFGAFIYKLYHSLTGHNPVSGSTVDVIIFIAAVSVMTTILSLCIVKHIKRDDYLTCTAVNLGVIITVANVWFCNILSFPECVFITAVGVCLCYGAIVAFVKANCVWGYVLSGVLLICATGVYQQFISVYAIYVIALCGTEAFSQNNMKFKQIVLLYIKPALIIIFSGVIYLFSGKLIQNICGVEANSRVALSLPVIIENIIYFATHQHSYLKGRGSFSSETLTLCFLIVGALWFILAVKDWIKNKKTIKTLFVFASYAVAYVSAFLPGILSTSHAARAMFALFAVFSLFTIGILFITENRYVKIFVCAVLTVVFAMNTVASVKGELRLKKQNEIDREWCTQVIDEIDIYEEEHGQIIKTIYYCYDGELNLGHSESAVSQSYSLKSLLEYYSGRDFEVTELSEEQSAELFKGKEWEDFQKDEQMIFEDDILYLCCY